jgi:segregation and condensation protein A
MAAVEDSTPYKVQLEVFEGPMDLLLHLIRTQEIDIYDIPISEITEQYLEYLKMMKDLNITVAGEFLVMASTLIYIKSRMLLPTDPETAGDEEIEDPRLELVEQLLEHERFKKAAGMLHDRQIIEDSVWPRGEDEFEQEETEAVSANVFDLVKAFHRMVERYKENILVEVERENITLEEKLAELRKLLSVKKEILFSSFLKKPISRLNLVVTFIAILEMAKLNEVRMRQKGLFEDIRIIKHVER